MIVLTTLVFKDQYGTRHVLESNKKTLDCIGKEVLELLEEEDGVPLYLIESQSENFHIPTLDNHVSEVLHDETYKEYDDACT